MENKANTQFPVHDSIERRWSPRAFKDVPVEDDKLRSLLEAARWAPSCFNEQPWSFLIAVKGRGTAFKIMLDCLVDSNREWAKAAPVLIISVARLTFTRNGKPNRFAYHDLGLAVSQLVHQATELGLAVHQMGGIKVDEIRRVYGIPEGFDPVAGIAIGYPGEPELLPPALAERERAPRTRKTQAEFAFTGTWGTSL